ncbi:MAG: hypothetical protein EXX96DRAFT_536335 [Benjaminiella poitrasii]|nr:MAG: hypothetical protein EXX96DRAFT_536335 [Benjaminiella poitrasii]
MVDCLGSFSNGWDIDSAKVPDKVTHARENGSAHISSGAFPTCLPMVAGGFIDGFFGGNIQTKFDRKKTIIFNNLDWILGGLLQNVAVNPAMFIISRILCGLGSLANLTYVGEISTIKTRGTMETKESLQRHRPNINIDKEFFGKIEGQLSTAAARVIADMDSAFINKDDVNSFDDQIEDGVVTGEDGVRESMNMIQIFKDSLIRRIALTILVLQILTLKITPVCTSSAIGAINFLIGQCFPIVFEGIKGYSFAIFAGVAVIAIAITHLMVPEPKGSSLEDISSDSEKNS